MASGSSSRELAATSPAFLPQKLHSFFANTVCKVFKENGGEPPEDGVVQQELVVPLQWLLCGGDPHVVFASLEQHRTPANFCGKVFKSGEPAYFCKDCQTDPTCCLCMECFEKSVHKTHRYRLFASGGGGCCDCGDPEAWRSGVYCEIHQPAEENEDQVDPESVLPPDLADRARAFFTALLWYCMNVLSWEESKSLPPELTCGHTAECLTEDSFLTYLYNDEIHSYDEVIYTLTHNVRMTHTEAVSLATIVDRKGRAVAMSAGEVECEQCKTQINTDLSSNVPLKVLVFHSAVAAHQSNAIISLMLAKEMAEKSAAFRRVISKVLAEVSMRTNCSLLDKFFLNDSSMWITARINWHRLLMSSIFMDPVYKKDMAINLTKNYCELQKNFISDSHHHDVCASNMTVQLFTVPSLSRMLVTEHGLLSKIVGTLLELLTPCRDPDTGVLRLRSSNYKHSRMVYIMYDLRYVLRNKPEAWTEESRSQVLAAYALLLNLLGMMQNVDTVRRRRGAHVEQEDPWEHSFNLNIVLQPAVLLFVQWCCSDLQLLRNAVVATFRRHETQGGKAKLQFKDHSVDQRLVGRNKMELIVFDILKQPVSVHQPLPRVLACLLAGASSYGLSFVDLLRISPTDARTPLFLMEHSSRALVLSGQVLSGMWKRNGYSVVNQVINYQFFYSREIMYDKDILMLQCMAAILDPRVFMYALIYKFRLEKWITCPESDPASRGEPGEDALRFFISEAEEFFFLLIIIFTERYSPGVGEGVTAMDALRREVVHKLYISPLSHSELIKHFRMNDNENEIDLILKEVAVLKRAAGSGKSVFELKPDCDQEYNPFFYHYTRIEHSKAEDAHRKKIKAAGGTSRVTPSPPRTLPPFCAPFRGIVRLTQCPVLHRVFHCVFKQAATESKFWSDRLLQESLHLCGSVLVEECASEPQSLCNAALGRTGNSAFLEYLEQLLTNQRAEEHKPLLTWIVQYLRGVRDGAVGGSTVTEEVQAVDEQSEDVDKTASERKEKAQARRDRVMEQMAAMQRRFLEKNKEELEEVDTGPDLGPDRNPAPAPRSAVGVASLLDHTPSPREVTCILCQEETKDFALQERMFVQAVSVQRSAVLRRGHADDKDWDVLSAKADLLRGVYTSGCGHHMHAECWRRFLDNKQREHGRFHFFPLPGQSVQWEAGQFLCPLCQCFSNTALPLLPHVRAPQGTTPPCREVSLLDWRTLINMAVDLAENPDIPGSSVDPTFHDKLRELFPNYRKPSCYFNRSSSSTQNLDTEIAAFSQIIYTSLYAVDPDESSDKVCLAQWNNCSYSIASLEYNARLQGKFLLESLSSRQRDNVCSMVRLGTETKVRPSLETLATYVKELLNRFLLQTPPFTEFPCILEVDCFSMMVNLHFALTSLFASLSCPTGAVGEGGVVLPLMGITDEFLVRVCAVAVVIQYLLTCPPAMETDGGGTSAVQRAESSTILASGHALQQLWINFRKTAGLPSDSPPSPYDLYVGAQEHIYPFLQCSVLFFNSLSGVEFLYSSASLATRFEDLCSYLGLPSALHTLFDEGLSPSKFSLGFLAKLWCSHARLAEVAAGSSLPPILESPRQNITLPRDFSELVKVASAFKCPNRAVGGDDGDSGQEAMMCLLCGKLLCTNSYCCQQTVETEDRDHPVRIGGFSHHIQSCGAGMGMALWILEAFVVIIDATDVTSVKGCMVPSPYLDEYGEADPGLRRGNPLTLQEDTYRDLQQVWLQHRIPERISKEVEGNKGLLRVNWSKM